mgnify:CR=1 FL=1
MKSRTIQKKFLVLPTAGLVFALCMPGLAQPPRSDPTVPHTPPQTRPSELPTQPVPDIGPTPDNEFFLPELGPNDQLDEDLSTIEDHPIESAPEDPVIPPIDPARTKTTSPILDPKTEIPEPVELGPGSLE